MELDGHVFDSKREAQRYRELKWREAAGEVRDIKLQVPYAIVINNQHVCDYIADFVYEERMVDSRNEILIPWQKRVADAKGMKTVVYRLKKKLMRAALGIEIIEL